jgi:hypothetical protein
MQTMSRKLWRFGKVVGGLVIFYVLLYLLLSLCGQYRPMSEGGLGRMRVYSSWAPFGFYDPNHSPPGSVAAERGMIIGTWRVSLIQVFYPLWIADILYVHKNLPSPPSA